MQAERLACIALDRIADVMSNVTGMIEHNRKLFNEFAASRTDIEQGVAALCRRLGQQLYEVRDRLVHRIQLVVPIRFVGRRDAFPIPLMRRKLRRPIGCRIVIAVAPQEPSIHDHIRPRRPHSAQRELRSSPCM